MLIVDRREDMSPDGYLRLLMEDDGDIIVVVTEGDRDMFPQSQVQFCTTFGGGGASPKVHKALRELMVAMAEENRDGNTHRRNEFLGEDVLTQLKQPQSPAETE